MAYVIEPKAAAKERQIMDVAMLWYHRQQEQLEAREAIESILDNITEWLFDNQRNEITAENVLLKLDEFKREGSR